MTPDEIRTVTFEKQRVGGYRREDVDAFLQQLAGEMDALQREKDDLEGKLYVLAAKIEEYRKDEDNVKAAMLNAQRMADSVVKEARKKSEDILRQAGIRADDIVQAARDQVVDQQNELARLQAEVAKFKADVMSLYRQHIESLATLPDAPEAEEEAPVEEPAPAPAEEPAEPAPVPAMEESAEEESFDTPVEAPEEEIAVPAEEPASAFTLDLSGLVDEEIAPAGQPKPSILDSFQGIKFSD